MTDYNWQIVDFNSLQLTDIIGISASPINLQLRVTHKTKLSYSSFQPYNVRVYYLDLYSILNYNKTQVCNVGKYL